MEGNFNFKPPKDPMLPNPELYNLIPKNRQKSDDRKEVEHPETDLFCFINQIKSFQPTLTVESCNNNSHLLNLLLACKDGDSETVSLTLSLSKRNSFFSSPNFSLPRKPSGSRNISLGGARKQSPQIEDEIKLEQNETKNNINEPKVEIKITDTNSELWSCLHVACYYSHVNIVSLLLQNGADINAKTQQGWTPLFISTLQNNSLISKLLLTNKNLDAMGQSNSFKCSPLHLSAFHSNVEIFDSLMQLGMPLQDDQNRMNPLFYAYCSKKPTLPMIRLICTYLSQQNITVLSLRACGMVSLPPDDVLELFKSLETLDVSNNAIQYLSPILTGLPALNNVIFDNNPLSALPVHVRNLTWQQVKNYLNQLNHTFSNWNSRCCVVVGDSGVGKSLLIRNLCFGLFENIETVKHKEKHSNTKGIIASVKKTLVSSSKPVQEEAKEPVVAPKLSNLSLESSKNCYQSKLGEVNITYWRLGQHLTNSSIHQFFLLGECIFIVLYNLETSNYSDIDYWVNQIKLFRSGNSPILLVGTHSDSPACTESYIKQTMENLEKRFPLRRFKGLHPSNFFTISNVDGTGINQLKDTISSIVYSEKKGIFSLPQLKSRMWIVIRELLLNISKNKFLLFSQFKEWAFNYFNIEGEEIEEILKFYGTTGSLIHFGASKREELDFIIMDPIWFSNIMIKFMLKNPFVRLGRIRKSDVIDSLSGIHLHYLSILWLLERYKIIFPIPNLEDDEDTYLIPCVLNVSKPEGISDLWPMLAPTGLYECQRLYCFKVLPLGFHQRVIVEILHLSKIQSYTLWKDGVIAVIDEKYYLKIVYSAPTKDTFQLHIAIRYPQRDSVNIFRSIIDVVENILDGSFPHLVHSLVRFVPCVHCVMRRSLTGEPYLFSYEQCISAVTSGMPFLFCRDIQSSSRCVRIDKLAPDISFSDIQQIRETEFTVGRLLGQGGFGMVYYGVLTKYKSGSTPRKNNTDEENNENNSNSVNGETSNNVERNKNELEIAIKELNVGEKGNNEVQISGFSDFLREVYIMSHLHHPNLVSMYGICLTTPPLRLIMEFIPCGDLYQLLRSKQEQNQLLSLDLISKIAIDIAIGMNHLHSISPPIIHRDLRSPNIFLSSIDPTSKICAKVADFGLSRMITTSKVQGTLGTWQWMAPETLDTNGVEVEYDEKADVYSFGVILWELFTCLFPFDEFLSLNSKYASVDARGDLQFKLNDIKKAIVDESLRPAIPDHIPEKFKELIEICWQRDPSSRPDFRTIALTIDANANVDITMDQVNNEDNEENEQIKDNNEVDIKISMNISVKCEKFFQIEDTTKYDSFKFPFCLVNIADRVWVGCKDGTIVIYDTRSSRYGEEETRWPAHENVAVTSITYIPITNVVWTTGADGTIKIWPPNAKWEYDLYKKLGTQQKFQTPLRCASLIQYKGVTTMWTGCPDRGLIFIWNIETYSIIKIIKFDKKQPVFDILLDRDSILIASFEKIFFVDARTFELLGNFESHPKAMVNCLTVSNLLLWSAGSNGEIRLWQRNGDGSIALHKTLTAHMSKVNCLCTDNDGFVWSGSFDKTIIVWDSLAFIPFTELDVHKDAVREIVPVGRRVWSIGEDGYIAIWSKASKV